MDDPIVVVAIIGVVTTLATVISGLITSRGNVGIKALELAIGNYQNDNNDLRVRLRVAEEHVVTLTAQVNRCESDKEVLTERVNELTRRVDDSIG